jgi:hypothetical protein
MVLILLVVLQISSLALIGVSASAQTRGQSESPGTAASASQQADSNAPRPAGDHASGAVVLEWVPPAMTELTAQAAVKSSFTLDRTMLGLAAGLVPDSEPETRNAIGKLDGVSVHLLRFGAGGVTDEAPVEAIREAYHARGWKHMVTAGSAKGSAHNGTTDVWLVMDGTNLRGAVVLAETPKSLTLVTVAGNLSPIDLLHLRGHFGIPNFNEDSLGNAPR